MKSLISMKRLHLILIQGFLTVLFVSCNPPAEDQPALEQLDVFKVSSVHFSKFFEKYETFVSGLSQTDNGLLLNFVNEKSEQWSQAKTTTTVNCDCPGQSKCSCETWMSSCCVCWSAATHDGGCGSFMGMCSCRTEPKQFASARSSDEETFTRFNALNFRELIQFLESNKVDAKPLKQALVELEKYGLPLD